MRKTFLILHLAFTLLILLLVLAAPAPVLAQEQTTGGGGVICSPTDLSDGVSSSAGDVYICVNRVYRYAIVIGAIISVLFIVIAGYLYMFSGASEHYISTAKSLVTSSLVGMLVLLAGLLVLKQINPELLKLKTISPERIAGRDWVLPTAGGPVTGGTNKPPSGGRRGGDQGTLPPGGKCLAKQCPPLANAVDLGKVGIKCKNYCQVLGGGETKLAALKAYLDKNANFPWQVTEAYPPSSHHKSPCHYNGRCVDINPLNGHKTAANYDKLCVALKAVGLVNFLNEAVTTQNCGIGRSTTFSTGSHLHVILF